MYVTLADGRLVFPNRGNPPTVPPGYDVDPQDPFIMIPCYDACGHRVAIPYTMPCGRVSHRPWCKLHSCEASPVTCEDCPDINYNVVEPVAKLVVVPVVGPVVKSTYTPKPIEHAESITQDVNISNS